MVVLGQKKLYSSKSGCIRTNAVVIWKKWLYSGKIVVFLQSGCIQAKVVVLGQKWLYSGKVVLIGQKWQ